MHVEQFVWKRRRNNEQEKGKVGVGGEATWAGEKKQNKKMLKTCSARDRNSRKMEECSLRDDKENQTPNNDKAVHFVKSV
jgi:hypothetical protein